MTYGAYRDDKFQRRNLERWIENIINATIDIGKIVLASEKKQMPKSYKEVLLEFGISFHLTDEEVEKFSDASKLRNVLAHEYLDILYERIQKFLSIAPSLYKKLLGFLNDYLDRSKSDK